MDYLHFFPVFLKFRNTKISGTIQSSFFYIEVNNVLVFSSKTQSSFLFFFSLLKRDFFPSGNYHISCLEPYTGECAQESWLQQRPGVPYPRPFTAFIVIIILKKNHLLNKQACPSDQNDAGFCNSCIQMCKYCNVFITSLWSSVTELHLRWHAYLHNTLGANCMTASFEFGIFP